MESERMRTMNRCKQILACGKPLLPPFALGCILGCPCLFFALLCFLFRPQILFLIGIWGTAEFLFLRLYRSAAKISLTITDCRLYGYTPAGGTVDLPLSFVSGCSLAPCHTLKIHTPCQTYHFPFLKDPYTLYNVLITLTYKK